MKDADVWLDVQDAMEYYGVARNTLYNWRKKGKIKTQEKIYKEKLKGYEYIKDEDLKNSIDVQRKYDLRYNQ